MRARATAFQYTPKEIDPPYIMKARNMYRGGYSNFLEPFVQELEKDHDVDLLFISGGYRAVMGHELIYYYECQLKNAYGHRVTRPHEISQKVLERSDEATSSVAYDFVIITLSENYFKALRNDNNYLNVLSRNLRPDSKIFIIGKESALKEAEQSARVSEYIRLGMWRYII